MDGLKEIEKRLRRFEGMCLRRIMKIRWFDRVSEEEFTRTTRHRSIAEELRTSRWRWHGQARESLNKQSTGDRLVGVELADLRIHG